MSEMKSSGLLLVSFLVGFCSSKVRENCRQVEMNPTVQDFFLEKHVFKMMEINIASACEVNCFIEADCISCNLKPQQNGKYLCELSDSDHETNPQDLRYKEGSVYKSFKNRCSSALCPSSKRCQTGFTSKGYRCVCANGLMGEKCTEGPPSVQVVPEIIETVEGTNVTVMCNVTANPKPGRIIWKKSDGILSSARSIINDGILTILDITTQDNGSYVCTAINPWGAKSSSVHLLVYSAIKFCNKGVLGPPLVRVVPDMIETVEGRNVTVMCNAIGNPKPERITWEKSDGIISSGKGIISGGNLTILNISTQDNGSYVCSATNLCGAQSSSVHLRIYLTDFCAEGWTLIARFSNSDSKNWMRDDGKWWYDQQTAIGATRNSLMNNDMISTAFWSVSGSEIKITRSDDPSHTPLLQTTGNCLGGQSFRSKITSYGDLRDGKVWGSDRCQDSCSVQYGGQYKSTDGFQQVECNGNIQSAKKIGFWCDWSNGDGSVMMIGGGGSSCARADHGIGITEANKASFDDNGLGEQDFGYDARAANAPSRSYSLNLWIR